MTAPPLSPPPPTGSGVALLTYWFEQVWNQGNETVIDHLYQGVPSHGLDPGAEPRPVVGVDELKIFWRAIRGAFPDLRFEIRCIIEQGHHVAARWEFTGTHRGDFQEIAPTGRAVAFSGMTFAHIVDGVILEGWNNWDVHGLREQLLAADR